MNDEDLKKAMPIALAIGLTYLIGGMLWFLASIGLQIPFPSSPDALSALMLVIISTVFLYGIKPLREGNREGFAFLFVGMILAGILFLLQLLIMGSNFLGWLLGLDDWSDWHVMSDVTPTVWLFLMSGVFFSIARYREEPHEGDITVHLVGGE
jgi:hypothetical protein